MKLLLKLGVAQSMLSTVRSLAVVAALVLGIAGCMGQTKMTRLQDAAADYNMATRFGRMDVATELVAPQELGEFVRRHAAWGGGIRITDLEFGGIQPIDENKAMVLVTVGWQRPNESTLRVTQIVQQWEYGQGGWKLTSEVANAGDIGLLGEQVESGQPRGASDSHSPNMYYPSISIR
ncbi:MAG: hypothetical protein FWD57_13810 [Polyangiaceae bacterium]|nr:hypothetical protein [Polyangiaceae bacterium]